MPTLKTGLNTTAPWHWMRDQRGFTYLANGTDQPQVWDGLSSATRNWGIVAPNSAPTLALSAGGSLTAAKGYKYYYSYYNADSDNYSNPSEISSEVTPSAQNVRVSFSAASPDTQITHKRLWRNTNGQQTTFYKVADVSSTVNQYLDAISDVTVGANEVLEFDHDQPPDERPFITYHNGLSHFFGSRVEQAGDVTIAGTGVVGSATEFKASHVGQRFVRVGGAAVHTVSSVQSAGGLTLTASATAASGAAYRLYPTQRATWAWSKPNKVEYFPAANAQQVAPDDGDEPSGWLMVRKDLFACKRRHVYRCVYSQDPNPVTGDGGIFQVTDERGLVNQRCRVAIGSEAYLLDEIGVWMFDGAIGVVPIDMAIRRLIQPSSEPVAERINWAQKEKFHAVWDPKRDRVLFFVCLGTDTEPKNAFVYERLTERWSVETYQQAITSSTIMPDTAGKQRAWVGDENGYIWAIGVGLTDGAAPSDSGTLRGTATSGTASTLVDTGASFYTTGDGLDGVPVYIHAGTGSGQWRIISSNTGTQLTVSANWTTNPDSTSQYYIGAIEAKLRSKWFAMQYPHLRKRLGRLRLYFEPQTASQWVGLTLYHDFNSTAFKGWRKQAKKDGLEIPAGATSDGEIRLHLDYSDGVVEVPIGPDHVHFVRFELRYLNTEYKPAILGYDFDEIPIPGTGQKGG
jgi:hypothetical protein